MPDYIYTYKDGCYGNNQEDAFDKLKTQYKAFSKKQLLGLLLDRHFFKITIGRYKMIGKEDA